MEVLGYAGLALVIIGAVVAAFRSDSAYMEELHQHGFYNTWEV